MGGPLWSIFPDKRLGYSAIEIKPDKHNRSQAIYSQWVEGIRRIYLAGNFI